MTYMANVNFAVGGEIRAVSPENVPSPQIITKDDVRTRILQKTHFVLVSFIIFYSRV